MDALRLSQVRVPTADVSMVDFTVRLQRDASAESLAALFRGKAAAELKGVLGYTTEPLVSQDFVGCAALPSPPPAAGSHLAPAPPPIGIGV